MNNVYAGLILTTLAGLSTAIGSLIAFTCRKDNYKVLAFFMGTSAGVMIYISFMELLPEAMIILEQVSGKKG